MRIPSRIVLCAFAVSLALSCSDGTAPLGRSSPTPASSPTRVPTSAAPRGPDASPDDVPATAPPSTARGDPTPTPTGGEPDFSGTDCFPDVPTPVSVTAFAERSPQSRTDPVRIVVEIRASERAVVEHRHGQEFDVSVDRDGEEVWRWSAVAPFTDPYGYRHTYEPGRVRRFSAVWDGSPWDDGAPAGEYLVHGYLVGNMESPPPRGRFICFDDDVLTLTP